MTTNSFKIKPGFTLLEIMVAVFIFSMVVAVTINSLAVTFLGGRTNSNTQKQINLELNSLMQTISQKMGSANSIGFLSQQDATDPRVYGFRVINNILVMAFSNGVCAAIGTKNDNRLYMKQANCDTIPNNINTSFFAGTDIISSNMVNITNFSFPQNNEYSMGGTAPYLTVKIEAKDLKNEFTTTVQSSYGLEYEKVKNGF